jgi:hypothetical protein
VTARKTQILQNPIVVAAFEEETMGYSSMQTLEHYQTVSAEMMFDCQLYYHSDYVYQKANPVAVHSKSASSN